MPKVYLERPVLFSWEKRAVVALKDGMAGLRPENVPECGISAKVEFFFGSIKQSYNRQENFIL